MVKSYEELTFTDDFMFCKILYRNEELCKELLELILGKKIRKITYTEKQKNMDAAYDGKGIRLDVYVEALENKVYDIEMQNVNMKNLPKRSRYYQGMIDLNLIERGADYEELKQSYVIFICMFDIFGKGRHIYTFENQCREVEGLYLGDESVKIFLNAVGTEDDVSEAMKIFLNYLTGHEAADSFTRKLEDEVKKARRSRKWRAEYMTLEMKYREIQKEAREEGREEGRKEGREEGRAEGLAAGKAEFVLELLTELGEVPNDLKEKILEERDLEVLKKWHRLAISADSIENFETQAMKK